MIKPAKGIIHRIVRAHGMSHNSGNRPLGVRMIRENHSCAQYRRHSVRVSEDRRCRPSFCIWGRFLCGLTGGGEPDQVGEVWHGWGIMDAESVSDESIERDVEFPASLEQAEHGVACGFSGVADGSA